MKKQAVLCVMALVSMLATAASAAEMKMIGTVSAIKMVGNGAEMTLKDRKTEANIVLQVKDPQNMEKIKDRKVKVNDELRIRYEGDNKVIKTIQKTAGC